MKPWIFVLLFATGLAMGQDKPRVFVQGKGSQDVTSSGAGTGGKHWGSWGSSSTADSHDEGMEVTKNLQKECSGVIVTLSQANADYTVMLNRESKKNRGLLRTNSQIQVANRLGDVLGTDATQTVGNASKDACHLIMADWSQHGRIAVPNPRLLPQPPLRLRLPQYQLRDQEQRLRPFQRLTNPPQPPQERQHPQCRLMKARVWGMRQNA